MAHSSWPNVQHFPAYLVIFQNNLQDFPIPQEGKNDAANVYISCLNLATFHEVAVVVLTNRNLMPFHQLKMY